MHKNNSPYDTKRTQAATLAPQVWYGLGLTLLALMALGAPLRAEDGAQGQSEDQSRPVTLVELYTSQGCSSCPPADQFLQDLAEHPDVLPLSFHVDYWDSAQWQDPFSRKAFSLRQMEYQESLETEYVYTPQMVVSGRHAFPGGQRAAVMGAIDKGPGPGSDSRAPIITPTTNGRVAIAVPAVNQFADSTLYVAVYYSHQTTRVQGGENRGRILKHANIVKRLIALAPYAGEAQSYDFARADLDAAPSDGIAVFIQSDIGGSILSAAALPGRSLPAAQAKLTQGQVSAVR